MVPNSTGKAAGSGCRAPDTPALESRPTAAKALSSTAMATTLYKVSFLNAGRIYEVYAQRVGASPLWGFTEVADLVFDRPDTLVIDPSEERLRDEFADTRRLHLPMQSVIRVEEVERKGTAAIRDAASGDKVITPFPVPAKPR